MSNAGNPLPPSWGTKPIVATGEKPRQGPDLWERLERRAAEVSGKYDNDASLLLNDATDHFAGARPQADPRAWSQLLIYCPTGLLVKALCWRLYKRFTYRWRN